MSGMVPETVIGRLRMLLGPIPWRPGRVLRRRWGRGVNLGEGIPADAAGLRVTGFGHSHLGAFLKARNDRRRRAGTLASGGAGGTGRTGGADGLNGPNAAGGRNGRDGADGRDGPHVALALLGQPPFGQTLRIRPALVPDGPPRRDLAPGLRDLIDAVIRRDRPDAVFAVPMGNEYNALAMIRHPQPFEVDMPGEPLGPPDVPRIPLALMRAQIEDLARGNALLVWADIAAAARAAGARPILVPPPPPIADEAHIRAHPGRFGALVARHGLNPPALRRKLWLLYRDALARAAAQDGGTFVDVPDEIFEDGFLARCYWQGDPTHANGAYGAIMLDRVLAAASAAPAHPAATAATLAAAPAITSAGASAALVAASETASGTPAAPATGSTGASGAGGGTGGTGGAERAA